MVITVRQAARSDEARAMDLLLLAFSADPVTRWTWPDPQQYIAHFPVFAKAFGGGAFASESAFIAESSAGAALWLSPGSAPDEDALMALFERSVDGRKLEDVHPLLEQMGRYHPSEPHWYLPLMGVDPSL